MKKEFSQEEMEQILKNDAVIPASVDEKIKETYDRLGLTTAAPEEHDKGSASQKTRPVRLFFIKKGKKAFSGKKGRKSSHAEEARKEDDRLKRAV